jgi:hypothetical protein
MALSASGGARSFSGAISFQPERLVAAARTVCAGKEVSYQQSAFSQSGFCRRALGVRAGRRKGFRYAECETESRTGPACEPQAATGSGTRHVHGVTL